MMADEAKPPPGTVLFLALCIALALPTVVDAQVGGAFPGFSWGARFQATLLEGVPLDDPFAPLYNPAALSGCSAPQISIEQIRPFDVPVTAVAWCGPATGGHAIVRQTPAGLGFNYNTYTLAFTGTLPFTVGSSTLHVGYTPKLLFVSIAGTEGGYDDNAFGYAADVGLSVRVPVSGGGPFGIGAERYLSIGIAALDVTSRLQYGSGAAEAGAETTYVGAASFAAPRWLIGVSARHGEGVLRWGAGAEYVYAGGKSGASVFEGVALRVGAGSEGATVGVGVAFGNFRVDYAYSWRNDGEAEGGRHGITTRFYI